MDDVPWESASEEVISAFRIDLERIAGKPEVMAQIGPSGDYFRLTRHP